MRKSWSSNWKASSKPRKQRKYRFNAPSHILEKFLGAHLSPELRKKYGRRSFKLRSEDKVRVMRGSFSGHEGKVDRVNTKDSKVYVTGVEKIKKDGSKIMMPIKPSNLMITELRLGDKKREEKLAKR